MDDIEILKTEIIELKEKLKQLVEATPRPHEWEVLMDQTPENKQKIAYFRTIRTEVIRLFDPRLTKQKAT